MEGQHAIHCQGKCAAYNENVLEGSASYAVLNWQRQHARKWDWQCHFTAAQALFMAYGLRGGRAGQRKDVAVLCIPSQTTEN
eukprot:scaffold309412_cov17-Tisochrysis_lutea.AAC.2